ncbi:MAG: C40 family peptidase [Chitinophagaceae bacterium]
MHKEPLHRSEQVNQLLYGDRVEILELDNFWAKIRAFDDDYEGWCLVNQIMPVTKREFTKPAKYLNVSHKGRLVSEYNEIPLPVGAALRTRNMLPSGEKVKFKGKKAFMPELKPSMESIEACARRFLAAPYQWGGKVLQGVDCSGLTQVVMKINGMQIARDASQQAMQGAPVAFLQEARCGDLAFFANEEGRINHVGILLDEHAILHATETAGCVVIDKIDQQGIVSRTLRKRTHALRLIRRFF